MHLFKIDDKGELESLTSLSFEENDVYLVDDEEKHTIYIWVGISVSQEKKDVTAELARRLDKERGLSAKILIMKQSREYGSFLTYMHDLNKGNIPGKTIERRPEFRFEVPFEKVKSVNISEPPEEDKKNMETRIVEWLTQIKNHRKPYNKEDIKKDTEVHTEVEYPVETEEVEEPDFKTQIREAAYFLSLEKYSYNDLCWILAEKIQKMNLEMPSIEDFKKKAEEVFASSCTYDELCWLNAEMDNLIKKSLLQEQKRKDFDY